MFDPAYSPLPEAHGSASIWNPAAYLWRGGLVAGRTIYGERQRLAWEAIFEEGHVTRDGLNAFVSRLVSASKWLGLSDEQIFRIGAATEQFWANYCYLRESPLEPARGWTEQQRFHAIMGAIGDWQNAVDREIGLQASSVSALDARAPLGRLLRTAILGTFLVNDAATAAWLNGGHIDLSTPVGIADAASRALFGLGNGFLTAHIAAQMGAGAAKVTWENSPAMQTLQAAGNSTLAAGGVAWAGRDFLLGFNAALAGNPGAGIWHVTNAALDAAFTRYMYRAAKNETSRVTGQSMEGPGQQAEPLALLGTYLVLRELSAIAGAGLDPGAGS